MSKLSQELQVLFFLNNRFNIGRYVRLKEILDYLDLDEKSARQVRRYIIDLNMAGYYVNTRTGPEGGYRLVNPLNKTLTLAPNIALAMAIATRRNERVETALKEIPNYVAISEIEGDNDISNDVLDSLVSIINAIREERTINFKYKDYEKPIVANPYIIVYTNHTYYLFAVNNETLKKYDCKDINEIKPLGHFDIFENNYQDQIQTFLSNYGIMSGNPGTLRVKCHTKERLNDFIKYYEGKGKIDGLLFEVSAGDVHELYYPLFRISTKDYEFLDEEFKNGYLEYLKMITKAVERK